MTPVVHRARTAAAVLLLGLMSASAVAAQVPAAPIPLPKGVQYVRSAEGIDEYLLDNGLRVLFFPDASKASTSVVVTYLVGSRHEGYGETGMAHLLEHMLFKGTTRNSNIPAALTTRGMEYNASTSYDRTNYFESFDPDPEHLRFALELEADRMVNSLVARKDLDSEMTVVRNEYEMGENSPQGVLMQRLMSTAYLFHNYGNPIIGARSDIEAVPIERLQAFYRRYYQPDNAVLLVGGRFDPAQAMTWVAGSLGAIPKPQRELTPTYTREPVQDGERTVTVRRTGGTPLTGIAYHVTADAHPDAVAIDVLSSVLGDTPSGRLHKALVETGLATAAFGSSMTLAEPGVLMFFAVAPKDADLVRVRAALVATVEDAVRKPVSQQEFERARTALTAAWEAMFNDSRHLAYALSDAIASGDWRLMFLYRDRLKTLQLEDVQRVAQAYLRPSNRTSGDYLPTDKPERAEIPEAPSPSAVLKDWQGTSGLAAGEAFDPAPLAIEGRTQRLKLDNGALVALVPKRTRGQTVDVAITISYGDERSLANRGAAPDLTARMLMRGTKRHTRAEIDRLLDELKSRMGVTRSGPQSVDLILSTRREQLPAALALAAEVLREPSFPAGEFEQLRRDALTRLEQSRAQPEQQAARALQRQLSPFGSGHPRYVRSFDEQRAAISAASVADLQAFHADFYGGSHASIAVVGDFDAAAVATDLGRLLGSWTSRAAYAPIVLERIPAVRHDSRIETPDKANALVLGGLPIDVGEDDPDFAALELFTYMFGGSDMRSRLGDRIRQKDGLSYATGATLDLLAPVDRVHLLTLYAITAPTNALKVEQAFREELGRAARDGFSEQEVADARAGYLKASQLQRSEDGSLAPMLASDGVLGRNMRWTAAFEARVATLTAVQVNEAVRRRIDAEALSIVTAGDLAKGAQPAR